VRRALELRITALNVALLALCVITLVAAIAADQACFDYDSLLYAPACPLGESLHAVCAACLALGYCGAVWPNTQRCGSNQRHEPKIKMSAIIALRLVYSENKTRKLWVEKHWYYLLF
jgi:hypothetical protein